MHPELAKLAHLQEVEQESATLAVQAVTRVRRVAAREAALNQTTRQLEENKKALAHESATRRRMESDTDDLRLKSTRYRAQLENVQSEDQARALQHQITFCKQEIDRIEEIEFASLIQTETLETQQRVLHETIANLSQAFANEKADAQLAASRDAAQQAEFTEERDVTRRSIEPNLLSEYDRISSAHKPAVAQVDAQRCSVCRMMVRPQRWNEIRAGEVHFCESCGRFLYYNPPVDLSAAIQLPPGIKKPAGPAQGSTQSSSLHAASHGHPTRED